MAGKEEDKSPITKEDELVPEGKKTHSEKTRLKPDKYGNPNGMGVLASSAFVVGEMAGSGVLALPKAVADTSWIGIPLIVVCGIVAGYCGINLGRCWNMMQERWPQYRSDTRDPYPAMAEQAFGKPMRYTIRASMYLLHFGATTVFLLLASQNIQSILDQLGAKYISFCYWLVIIAIILIPLSWPGTPKDFWPIATGAGAATIIACILAVIAMAMDSRIIKPTHSVPSFHTFFLAFGAILFAFGGASAFPTIQHDMKEPRKFKTAAIVSCACLISMYLPVAITGFVIYGDAVQVNIIQSLPEGILRLIVEMLITGHVVLAFVILFNPVAQDLEELLKIPLAFNWKRAVLRTALIGLILFAAQTVPNFGPIVDFIGGSTVALTTFIAPPLFYLKFKGMKGDWKEEPLPWYIKVLNVTVIIIGVIGGIAATYSAITELISSDTFVPPCYVNITGAEGE